MLCQHIRILQNSVISRCSLSLKRNKELSKCMTRFHNKSLPKNKENSQNLQNFIGCTVVRSAKNLNRCNNEDIESIEVSAIQDLNTLKNISDSSNVTLDIGTLLSNNINEKINNESLISVSSATDLKESQTRSESNTTVLYEYNNPIVNVSFGVTNCKCVEVSTNNSNIKRIVVTHDNNDTKVDCEVIENSQLSLETDLDENKIETLLPSPPKKLAVTVNLDIKKNIMSRDTEENSKVLILNTDAIEKLSHVIVQPPNYKLVKRKILDPRKFLNSVKKKPVLRSTIKNGKTVSKGHLRYKPIESYFNKADILRTNKISESRTATIPFHRIDIGDSLIRNEAQDMSKTLGDIDVGKFDRGKSCKSKKDNESPRSVRVTSSRRENESPKGQAIKTCNSDAPRVPSPKERDSMSLHSPRKTVESLQFSLPSKTKSNKTSVVSRSIPHHKIVAGTHFAVDAFSYGEIPNVKHYFLTHFHSDHYSGLKKSFNKLLFCSKITADLCISRLGVSPKYIHVINPGETIRVESVEVTVLDANHCPGAIMLVFTLPNGKTLLHCGDFRACPAMESYPIFWNKDIHTIYLDTTYCNPRYNFPTQDQSLEMAVNLLRQKKLALEKDGKSFSSVLIVCGTYTIGKEKFFLGMAKRVGCSVWAFPEKDRVLQAVEGRSFSQSPPQSCQLHVLAMRDLTHEKLRSHLDSLQGAFTEVVAFKPSGWENSKNSTVEKDMVTIHGIPYSEHSSFSEMIRFVKFLMPKQVVPTVDISGGIKAVQKYFPCPLIYKDDPQSQSKVTDFFSIQSKQRVSAVT
ncbi:DNA cross-link repair 1A protein isoform X2 [Galleria mellonella]|uniref:DNA cross-link repair 1A protein isoform X2 n=1 Tax=Galleria mellonella TaxID=7137 RepID=A0A6J1WK84_GALME|nr:DNA cross-link repair 1A protein isoform X2 [Galleria mellonella]